MTSTKHYIRLKAKGKKGYYPRVKKKWAPWSTNMLIGSPGVEPCGNQIRKVFMAVDHKLSLAGSEQMQRRDCTPRNGQSVEKVLPTKMNSAQLEDFPELEDIREQ